MKKLLFATFVALFGFTSANAQIVENLEYPRAHFGIRGQFTSSSFTGYDALPFAGGGLAADFRIAPIPLYLETGLYYAQKGYKYESYYDEDEKETWDNHSVLMPLLVSYHLYFTDNLSIQPFTGAYVSYGFNAEEVDYGLRFGCGFNFGRLYANVGYDLGLKNYESYDYHAGETKDLKSGMLFLTVGFNFAGSY